VASFASDLPVRWAGQRILVVGHVATWLGLEHYLLGTPLEQLAQRQLDWRPGWEYTAHETAVHSQQPRPHLRNTRS